VQSLENIKLEYEQIAELLPEFPEFTIPEFIHTAFLDFDSFEGDDILTYILARLHHISILHRIEAPSELIVEHFTDVYTLLGGASVSRGCCHTQMDDESSEMLFLHHLYQVGDDSLIYSFNKYCLHRGYTCAMTPYTPLIPLGGDIAESTEALDLTHVQLHSTSAMNVYQMKFDLYNSTKVLKMVAKVLNADCTSLISDFLGVKASCWQVPNASIYVSQAAEILHAMHNHDKHGIKLQLEQFSNNNPCRQQLWETHFIHFLTHFSEETKRISIPRNILLEEDRLNHALDCAEYFLYSDTSVDAKILATQILGFEIDSANYVAFAIEHSRGEGDDDLFEDYDDLRQIIYGMVYHEHTWAHSYFHLHKHDDGVKGLFATMNVDSSKIVPKKHRLSLHTYVNPELFQVVKLLEKHGTNTKQNYDLCFGNAWYMSFYNNDASKPPFTWLCPTYFCEHDVLVDHVLDTRELCTKQIVEVGNTKLTTREDNLALSHKEDNENLTDDEHG
jgi:hypothetical protein